MHVYVRLWCTLAFRQKQEASKKQAAREKRAAAKAKQQAEVTHTVAMKSDILYLLVMAWFLDDDSCRT